MFPFRFFPSLIYISLIIIYTHWTEAADSHLFEIQTFN